jgi:hypothetical protein
MVNWGGSYPPGCSRVQGDDAPEPVCDTCGEHPDDCTLCPACPVCQGKGDLGCYATHGLRLSIPQLEAMLRRARADEAIHHQHELQSVGEIAQINGEIAQINQEIIDELREQVAQLKAARSGK